MDEQQPKADSVTVMDVAPAEAGETPPQAYTPTNPFGLLTNQFTVAAEAAWTDDQRQAIQKELFYKAQAMRERLETFLDQLRAERVGRHNDEPEQN